MATANQWWKPIIAKLHAFAKWLWSSLKSQWVATTLLIPIGFLIVTTHLAREDAKEARRASVSIDRISKVQESGKTLDLALASYYQATAQLGLSERHLRMPGTYSDIPVAKAQNDVVEARVAVQKAMGAHAGDLQSLRGVFDPEATARYTAALADVNAAVDSGAEINGTGRNITVLAKLVKARNDMVDTAMKRIG